MLEFVSWWVIQRVKRNVSTNGADVDRVTGWGSEEEREDGVGRYDRAVKSW